MRTSLFGSAGFSSAETVAAEGGLGSVLQDGAGFSAHILLLLRVTATLLTREG